MNNEQTATIVSSREWDDLRHALDDLAHVDTLPTLGDLKALPAVACPDLVLIDIDDVRENLNGCALTSNPGAYIVFVSDQHDPAVMRLAMRYGARDFLARPFDPDHIREIMNRAAVSHKTATPAAVEPEPSQNRDTRIFTFFTTKGGAGKSTLLANFAWALSQRNPDARICLLDMDLQFGDLAMIFNAKPRSTIVDAIGDEALAEHAASYLTQINESISLLAAPPKPEEAELIKGPHVETLLDSLTGQFDYILIDTAPSFQDVSLVSLDRSHKVFLVVTPIILSVKNLKRVLEVMSNSLGYENEKVEIILNRSDSKFGITKSEIENLCKRKVNYMIPSDGNLLVQTVNAGTSALTINPRNKYSLAVTTMATALGGVAAPGPARRKRGLMSLFRK